MKAKDPSQLNFPIQDLAGMIGSFIEYWGFKTIHGRIWTLLYLSKKPLSATELCKLLNVSKTLLSFSISELLEYQVIIPSGKGAKRTIYFTANNDLSGVIINVLKKREHPLLIQIQSSFNLFQKSKNKTPGSFEIDPKHMNELGNLISAARETLETFIVESSDSAALAPQLLLIAALLAQPNAFQADER